MIVSQTTVPFRSDSVRFLPSSAEKGPPEGSHLNDAVDVQVASRIVFHEGLPEMIHEMHSR
jgi:hypothetical protein